MIFGINFNGTPIPDGWARRFPKEMKIYRCGNCGKEITRRQVRLGEALMCGTCNLAHAAWVAVRGNRSRLVGVATDAESRDTMLIQATNGRRQLHVETREAVSGKCYGIYSF